MFVVHISKTTSTINENITFIVTTITEQYNFVTVWNEKPSNIFEIEYIIILDADFNSPQQSVNALTIRILIWLWFTLLLNSDFVVKRTEKRNCSSKDWLAYFDGVFPLPVQGKIVLCGVIWISFRSDIFILENCLKAYHFHEWESDEWNGHSRIDSVHLKISIELRNIIMNHIRPQNMWMPWFDRSNRVATKLQRVISSRNY